MYRTLLLMSDLDSRLAVDRLEIRDCTVFTDNNYLFSLREQPAVLSFERVRFCGFDMGAGSSCLFGTKGIAILASDCRIEGGYGRAPATGNLFRVDTDAVLARFERCTFSRISLFFNRLTAGVTLDFVRCRFENLFDREEWIRQRSPGIAFDDSPIAFYDRTTGDLPALDINDLFPDWKNRVAR